MPKAVYTPFQSDEEQKPADSAIQSLLDQLRNDVEAKLGKLVHYKALHYYTRSHGAPIHYVKVQTGDNQYAHVTVMEPRYGKAGAPTLSDVLADRKLEDPLEAFGLHFD